MNIPNCSQAYFPDVSDPNGIPVSAIDETDDEDLNLRLHIRFNKMYVLEGFKEFMVSHKLQAGDTCNYFVNSSLLLY